MKRSKISGWEDVYCFTLVQTLKSKVFLISFLLLIVLGFVSMPIMSLIKGEGVAEESYDITKLYLYDETGIMADAALLKGTLAQAGWTAEVEVCDPKSYGSEAFQAMLEEIDKNRQEEVVLHITWKEGIGQMYFLSSEKGKISSNEVERFGQVLMECHKKARYVALGITKEQEEQMNMEIGMEIVDVDLQGEEKREENTSISTLEYGILYALLFAVMMICTMAGSQVAASIVMEKSSKVVEYLLISVRPLAIVVGKVLAMLCIVTGEVICLMVIFALSNYATERYISGGESMLEKYLTPEILGTFQLWNILLCLLFIALGLVFYATLAGLVGATISKMEEMGEGMTLFSLTVLAGFYIGIGAAATLLNVGEGAFVTFAFLCPLSSPFIMPGAIFLGKAQTWMILVSMLLLGILIFALFQFVARVYETLIVHNGSRIKLRQLFKI